MANYTYNTWDTWATNTYTSTTSATTSIDSTWNSWNSTSTDASNIVYHISTSDTWDSWHRATPQRMQPIDLSGYIEEETVFFGKNNTWKQWNREEQRAQSAQQEIERIWKEEETKDAEEVAEELLGELIGDEQLAVYKETGRVIVKGKKHDYLVRKGCIPTIIKKDKIQDICIHLNNRHAVPKADQVIADILGFKYAEDYMLQTGNLHSERDKMPHDETEIKEAAKAA